MLKKIAILFVVATLYSCEKNEVNDLLPKVVVDETINLNLPQYINLLTPTGSVYNKGGYRGILIQNTGIGNPPYKAFERACPNNDCTIPMNFDGSLKMKCSCDQSEYSIIDGSSQTKGFNRFAREYKVVVLNNNTIYISNF